MSIENCRIDLNGTVIVLNCCSNAIRIAKYTRRQRNESYSLSYCIEYDSVGLTIIQGKSTVVSGSWWEHEKLCPLAEILRCKLYEFLRSRRRCAVIVLHLRISAALATIPLLYSSILFSGGFSSLISRQFGLEKRSNF